MEISYSYQNNDLNKLIAENSLLKKKIKKLKAKCLKLEEERNEYMHDGAYEYLYKKYVGLYNEEDRSLIVHHFIDQSSIFPYGNASYVGDFDCFIVVGGWDNWSKEHTLRMKCVRDSSNNYEGYVYYITLDNELKEGDEYQFKFKDEQGLWIEPVDEVDGLDSSLAELKQDSEGIWNAVLRIKIQPI